MNWKELEEKGEVAVCFCGTKMWIHWHKDKKRKGLCGNCFFERG